MAYAGEALKLVWQSMDAIKETVTRIDQKRDASILALDEQRAAAITAIEIECNLAKGQLRGLYASLLAMRKDLEKENGLPPSTTDTKANP